ncbi:MAG: MFS transporter [Alphaproteobacteria bacterium]|nr:MFS transporter [Alphaproteobacteria bacterium]
MSNRWAILALLVVVRATFAFQFGSVSAVSPFLIHDLAIDYATLGTLVSLYLLPGIAVSMPGGIAGGRFGEQAIAVVGLAIMVLGGLMTAAAEGYALAAGGRVVAGVGAALVNVMLTKMVMDWFAGREMATAMAIFLSSWPLGIALALLTLAPLAAATSLFVVFATTAAVAAAGLVLIASFYRRAPGAPRASREKRSPIRLIKREIWLVALASVAFSFCSAAFVTLVSFLPLYLVESGRSAAAAAQLASIAPWAYAVGVPLGGMLADRTGRANAIVFVSCAVTVIGVGMVPLVPAAGVLPGVLLGVLGLASALPQGIIKSLLVEVLRPEARSAGLGFHLTLHYAGLTAIPPAVGAIADLAGTPLAAVLGAAVLMATAGLFYWWTRVGIGRGPLVAGISSSPS